MPEVVATDWLDLQHHLFSDTWDPAIKRHRSKDAYRGLNPCLVCAFDVFDEAREAIPEYGKEPSKAVSEVCP